MTDAQLRSLKLFMGLSSSSSKLIEQLATVHTKALPIPNLEPSTPVRAINLVCLDTVARHDHGESRENTRNWGLATGRHHA